MSAEWTERTVAGKTIYEPAPSTNTPDSADSNRFDQSKKEWAAELNAEVASYLCEFYDVDERAIYDYEGLHSGEYDVEDATRALQIWDYTGVDKLVDLGTRIVGVAYRSRPQSEGYDVDFSYCTDNGTEKDAEYTKHLNAYKYGGIYPTHYAFGIVAADEQSFDAFHMVEMNVFLDRIDNDDLNPDGPHKRKGDVWAKYYSVDELRAAGCIARSWGDV